MDTRYAPNMVVTDILISNYYLNWKITWPSPQTCAWTLKGTLTQSVVENSFETKIYIVFIQMAETDVDNELLDYEEDEEPQGAPESGTPASKKEVKGSYVSIHSSGFRDFLLKPELLRAIVDCGFEHPSEGE